MPVTSFIDAETFDGANIMGNEPARPFVMPNAAVKMNAGVSSAIIGCFRGAQHIKSNGTNAIRNNDSKIN